MVKNGTRSADPVSSPSRMLARGQAFFLKPNQEPFPTWRAKCKDGMDLNSTCTHAAMQLIVLSDKTHLENLS